MARYFKEFVPNGVIAADLVLDDLGNVVKDRNAEVDFPAAKVLAYDLLSTLTDAPYLTGLSKWSFNDHEGRGTVTVELNST